MTTKIKCNRCGFCCINVICQSGKEGKNGLCKNLIFNKNETTTCDLIVKGKIKLERIAFGKGCFLKKDYFPDNIYKKYKKKAEEILKTIREC